MLWLSIISVLEVLVVIWCALTKCAPIPMEENVGM